MLKPEGATKTIKHSHFWQHLIDGFQLKQQNKKLTVGAEVIDQDYLLDQRLRTSHQDTEPEKRREEKRQRIR